MNSAIRKLIAAVFGMLLLLTVFAACSDGGTPEKLLLEVKAESAVEVKTVFKPEVKTAEGCTYELIVTAVPSGAETPAVSEQSFVPDKTGEYSYKIVVTQGERSEEQAGKVQSVDTTAPAVSGEAKSYKIERGDTLVFSEMTDNLSVSDNYDAQPGGLQFKKITKNGADLETAAGITEYTFESAGEYEVLFSVSDSSANETVVTVPVTVEGFDVPDVSAVTLYVGDTLTVPEYSVLPEGAGRVVLLLDDEEISEDALPVFTQPGEHTLKLCYFSSDNQTAEADETVAIGVTVEAIDIECVIDAEGKEAGFTGKIPQPVVNDPRAAVTVTLQKPGEDVAQAVTPSESVTYEICGYYTYTVQAAKGEIRHSETFTVYIREKNEVITFEDARGGSVWDGIGATDTATVPELSGEQVKYGKYSVKMVLPQGRNNELVYNVGTAVGKEYNTVSLWIYSTADTELRLGLAQNDESHWWLLDPNGSESFSVQAGWNQVSLMIADSSGNGQICTIRITNVGAADATVYIDGISFYTDLYILSGSAPKDIVKGTAVDLNEYFRILGISEATEIEITAEKGSISLREYTAPLQTGPDTVTVKAAESGKTSRELEIVFNIISVSFEVPDDYNAYYDINTDIAVKQAVQEGAENPVIKIEVVSGDNRFEPEGGTFRVTDAGWVKVIYTLTCDNEQAPLTVEKTFYAREAGEVLTFEDYAGSGKNYANTAGSSADIAAPVPDSTYAKSGQYSMRFVLGGGQIAMLNYAAGEYASKPVSYNTIRIALYSETETSVRFGFAQNDESCWWFIDPNASGTYQVSEGWNEIVIMVPEVKGGGDLVGIAITNCGTEQGAFCLDSVRFLTEISVSGKQELAQVIVNTETELADYVNVTGSDSWQLTVKVGDETISGTKYTFPNEGMYNVVFTVKDNVSGIEKSCTVRFEAKNVSMSADDYENTVLGASVTIHACTVEGAEKNLTVTVYKPQGGTLTLAEGESFDADEGGWYTVLYAQPNAEGDPWTLEKNFYAGYANELLSFENIPRNGQGGADDASTPTSSAEVSSEQAYFGEYSMKFTNINKDERAQVMYDGNAQTGTAPIISDNSFTKIKMWVYSETAVSVTIAVQGGGDTEAEWGWLTSTAQVTELQAGWQEISLDRNAQSASKYIASIFVDKKTEGTNGIAESIYIDCIRFVSE